MSYKKFLIAAATFALCISAASSCKKYYIDDEQIDAQIDSLSSKVDSLAALMATEDVRSIILAPDDKSDGAIFSLFPFNGKGTDTVLNDLHFIVSPASVAEILVARYNLGDTNVNFSLPLKDVYTKSVYSNELHIHRVDFNEYDSTVVIRASGAGLADYTDYGGHYSGQLFIDYDNKCAESQFFNLRNDINFQKLWFYNDPDNWAIYSTIANVGETVDPSTSVKTLSYKGVMALPNSKLSGVFYTGNYWSCDRILPSNFTFDLSSETKEWVENPAEDGTFTFKSDKGYGRYLVNLSLSTDYSAKMEVKKLDFVEMIQDGTPDWALWGEEEMGYPAQRLAEISELNFEGFLWTRESDKGGKPSTVFTDWRGNGYYGVYCFDEKDGVSETGRRTTGSQIIFDDGPGQYYVQMNVKDGKMKVRRIESMNIVIAGKSFPMKLDTIEAKYSYSWGKVDASRVYYSYVINEKKSDVQVHFAAKSKDGEVILGGARENLTVGGSEFKCGFNQNDTVKLFLNRIQRLDTLNEVMINEDKVYFDVSGKD